MVCMIHFLRSALWYSLGRTSLGLQDGKRPAWFGVPYKLCQGGGLNLDWLPLVVWRAARAEGASQGLEWQCYVNGYLLSLGCKGESGPSSESCLVLGGGSRALLSTTFPSVIQLLEINGYLCVWALHQIRGAPQAGLGGSKLTATHFSSVQESLVWKTFCLLRVGLT